MSVDRSTLYLICAATLIPFLGLITYSLIPSGTRIDEELIEMAWVSIATISLSLILIFLIKVSAKISRGKRKFLLISFRSLLWLTQLITVLIVIANGGILALSVLSLEAYYFGRVTGFLILIIFLSSIWAALKILWFIVLNLRSAQMQLEGILLNHSEYPKIINLVETICKEMDVLPPNNIVVGLEPNFFVTESKIALEKNILKGRTLYMAIPISQVLSNIEFKAVLGHEMAHFKGEDTAFSLKFFPIYRGAQQTLSILQNQISMNNDLSSFALLPAWIMNKYFLNQFTYVEKEISRHREFAADQVSSSYYSQSALSFALIKIHSVASYWPNILNVMRHYLSINQGINNSCKLFNVVINNSDSTQIPNHLIESQIPHPTDTHPPLKMRLHQLRFDLTPENYNEIMRPEETDGDFLDNLEILENTLTKKCNINIIDNAINVSLLKQRLRYEELNKSNNTSHFLLGDLLFKMLIVISLENNEISEESWQNVYEIMHKVASVEVNDDDFIFALSTYEYWSGTLLQTLEESCRILNEEQKNLLLRNAILFASYNQLSDKKNSLLAAYGQKLKVQLPT